jgi:hypothetical protein
MRKIRVLIEHIGTVEALVIRAGCLILLITFVVKLVIHEVER